MGTRDVTVKVRNSMLPWQTRARPGISYGFVKFLIEPFEKRVSCGACGAGARAGGKVCVLAAGAKKSPKNGCPGFLAKKWMSWLSKKWMSWLSTMMVPDKRVLYWDSFAKYAAAFFSMSRSSVTRRNSALSLAISTEASSFP